MAQVPHRRPLDLSPNAPVPSPDPQPSGCRNPRPRRWQTAPEANHLAPPCPATLSAPARLRTCLSRPFPGLGAASCRSGDGRHRHPSERQHQRPRDQPIRTPPQRLSPSFHESALAALVPDSTSVPKPVATSSFRQGMSALGRKPAPPREQDGPAGIDRIIAIVHDRSGNRNPSGPGRSLALPRAPR